MSGRGVGLPGQGGTTHAQPFGVWKMEYASYQVKWILSFAESGKTGGFYGTTTHDGPTPAVAAIVSAESASRKVAKEKDILQVLILGVFDQNEVCIPLSNEDLSAALRRHPASLEFEVAYRPLC